MARQKQEGKNRKPNQTIRTDVQEAAADESQGSFADALNATQQHTVPVLPTYDAPRPLESQPAPAIHTTASPRTSYARATLAPGVSGRQRAASLISASTSSGDSTMRQTLVQPSMTQQATARHAMVSSMRDTVAGETTKNGTRDAEQSGTDLALAPGRPTFVLPAITGDRLPAVQPPLSERQLAVREKEEPQAVFIRGATKLPMPYVALAPRRHGPRPFITQFLVAMVTVMTLFAVLTLASPLGKGLAFSNSFQAYANAVPWIPTPTPTPKPTPAPQYYGQQPGVNPGQQVIINMINAVFGPYSGGALNIARCESGYDPNAYNSYPVAGSHAEGVFQILYPSTWSGTSYARYSPYDYNANIRAAYEIFHNDGNSWREWECRP